MVLICFFLLLFFLAFLFLRTMFSSAQFRITSATSRLFVPSIIMWVVPLKTGFPSSSKLDVLRLRRSVPAARRALIALTVVWHTALVAV